MFGWGVRHEAGQQGRVGRVPDDARGGGRAGAQAPEHASSTVQLRDDFDALQRRVRLLEDGADERALIHAGYVDRLNRLVRRLTKLDRAERSEAPEAASVGRALVVPLPPPQLRGVRLRRWMNRHQASEASMSEAQEELDTDGADVLASDETNGGE
jgi:hypothetical protein